MRNILTAVIILITFTGFTQNIKGLWFGNLLVAGQNISLELNITENFKNCVLVDIRGENKYPVELDTFLLEGNSIRFSVSRLEISYQGNLTSDSISGTFEQGIYKAPLSFYRNKPDKVDLKRPQEPVPPLSYAVKDIFFENSIQNFKLAGTLTVPKDSNRVFPIVILASGSGPQDRNEQLMGHQPFLIIADYLSSNGIGVLRFDDRGTGESEGNFEGSSIYDFSTDLEAALMQVKSLYPNHPVGILGHSEGGMHSLVLSERKEIDFLLFLAAIGTSGYKVLAQQNYDITLKRSNKSDAKWTKKGISILYKVIRKAENYSSAKRMLKEKLMKHYEKASETIKSQITARNYALNLSKQLANAYGKEFLTFEAKPYLKDYSGYVFAINGEKDIQVAAKENLKGFKRYAPKTNLFVKEYSGLNHLFQTCETCTVLEYGILQETISTLVLQEMLGWIKTLPF